MNTVKFHVPHDMFRVVYDEIKKNRIKYYPIRRVFGGYTFEIDEHPLVSFLILKHGLTTVQ